MTSGDIAVAIPTFGRNEPLIDTIVVCLDEGDPPGEVIVVDQTPERTSAVVCDIEALTIAGGVPGRSIGIRGQAVEMSR